MTARATTGEIRAANLLFAQRLRERREALGYSAERLSADAGMARDAVKGIEWVLRDKPGRAVEVGEMVALCRVLGVTVADMLAPRDSAPEPEVTYAPVVRSAFCRCSHAVSLHLLKDHARTTCTRSGCGCRLFRAEPAS